jgi:hypothetical protein
VRARLAPVALCLALASPAAAQTTDPVFARWRWAPPELGSRPSGMGGAFVAIADSARAAYANPAGLTQIPVTEVNLSSGKPWLAAGRSLTKLRVAAYVTKSDDQRVEALDSTVWEAGLGFGAEPLSGVRVGASMAWSRLDLEGPRITADGSTHLRLTAGALIDLVGSGKGALPSLRLGFTLQPGFDWSARSAGGAAPADIDIRRPTLISAGLAWRSTDRWGFSAQGDLIRYREVIDTLRRNSGDAAAGFRLPNAVEPRVGSEFTAPLWCGCGAVKVRGGLHYQSSGMLRREGVSGGQSWRTIASLGASLFTEHYSHAVRLDMDASDLFDGPGLSFGIVWRF